MPEKFYDIAIAHEQLSYIHTALVDYAQKMSGVVSTLACAGLSTDEAESVVDELRGMIAAFAELMQD